METGRAQDTLRGSRRSLEKSIGHHIGLTVYMPVKLGGLVSDISAPS